MMKYLTNAHVAALFTGIVLHSVASAADVVPLTFVNGLPFVTVKVGAAAAQLMVDSGGSLGISIPENTIEQAGSVRLLDQTTRFRDLQGQVYEVRNFVANRVTVGTTDLGQVEGRVHVQWGGAPEGPDAALTKARRSGAIGLAAFGKRPVMLDYRAGTLSIYAQGEEPQSGRPGWQSLPLDSGKIGPNITVVVNGKPLKFVLDTGAQVNLVNAKSLPAAIAAPACAPAKPGDEACDPRDLGAIQDSHGQSLGNLSAERMDLNGAPFDGILGAPFFQSRKVLFDPVSNRLLMSPANAKDTTSK